MHATTLHKSIMTNLHMQNVFQLEQICNTSRILQDHPKDTNIKNKPTICIKSLKTAFERPWNSPNIKDNPTFEVNAFFSSSLCSSKHIVIASASNSLSCSRNPKLVHQLGWNTSPQTMHLLLFFNISPKQNGWYMCLHTTTKGVHVRQVISLDLEWIH